MDKQTLSNYGWVVVLVLILSVLLALATPFGTFVADAIKSTSTSLFDVQWSALDAIGVKADKVTFDPSNPPIPFDPTDKSEITITINDKDYVGYKEMTWHDWLNSQFNIDAFHPYSSIITWTEDGSSVEKEELLIDNGVYTITELQITELQMTINFANNAYDPYEINYVEGMTWDEWVKSMYNTIGATINTDNSNADYVDVIMKEIDGVRYGLSSTEQCCATTVIKKDKTMPAGGSVYYFVPETTNDNSTDETEPEIQLISFSVIKVTPYTAEEGMTWAQWVASEYNIDGFYIENGKVYVDGQTAITIEGERYDKGEVQLNSTAVMSTDLIIDGQSYGLVVRTNLTYVSFNGLYESYDMLYAKEVGTGKTFVATLDGTTLKFGYFKIGSTYNVFTVNGDIKVGQIIVTDDEIGFVPESTVGCMRFPSDVVEEYNITKLVSATTGREIIGVISSNGMISFRATTFPDTWYIYSENTKVGTLTLDSTGNGSYTLGE